MNTIISLKLIVYYLIIANSGIQPSLPVYQTIYDSPSRDHCKILDHDIKQNKDSREAYKYAGFCDFHCFTSFQSCNVPKQRRQ